MQAMPYWQRAGQRAIERSAHLEAIAHLSKGLEVLGTLSETQERARQESACRLLGEALMAQGPRPRSGRTIPGPSPAGR